MSYGLHDAIYSESTPCHWLLLLHCTYTERREAEAVEMLDLAADVARF
jgi:hypothetical protein